MKKAAQELQGLIEERPILTATLVSCVRNYFQDEQHRKDFEAWYEKKYGTKYVWTQG